MPEPDPVTLHPGLADTYAGIISDLVTALNADEMREEAADILRGVIEKIVLTPNVTAPNGHVIEIFGELGAILTLCSEAEGTNAKARRGVEGVWQVTMVAGTRHAFYLPTSAKSIPLIRNSPPKIRSCWSRE